MDHKSSSSRSPSPGDVEGEPVAKKPKMVHKTIIYDESIPNQWLNEPPLEVWDHHIIPLLSLKDLALARPVCTFFERYWQDKFSNNVLPLRVGNDVATIEDVMGVIEILSSRREYTKLNPFVVLLGKGDHQITSSWTAPNGYERQTMIGMTRSNVTFVGTGKDTTTILGGFGIDNLENITFKNMTVTNTITVDNVKLFIVKKKDEPFTNSRVPFATNRNRKWSSQSRNSIVRVNCWCLLSRLGPGANFRIVNNVGAFKTSPVLCCATARADRRESLGTFKASPNATRTSASCAPLRHLFLLIELIFS